MKVIEGNKYAPGKKFAIVISRPYTMLSHDSFVVSVVITNLGIEVSHNNDEIMSWCFIHLCLKLVVEVVFVFVVAAIVGR